VDVVKVVLSDVNRLGPGEFFVGNRLQNQGGKRMVVGVLGFVTRHVDGGKDSLQLLVLVLNTTDGLDDVHLLDNLRQALLELFSQELDDCIILGSRDGRRDHELNDVAGGVLVHLFDTFDNVDSNRGKLVHKIVQGIEEPYNEGPHVCKKFLHDFWINWLDLFC